MSCFDQGVVARTLTSHVKLPDDPIGAARTRGPIPLEGRAWQDVILAHALYTVALGRNVWAKAMNLFLMAMENGRE